MKIYKFCTKKLNYVSYGYKFYSKLVCLIFIMSLLFGIFLSYIFNTYYQKEIKMKSEEEFKLIILKEHNKFECNSLIGYIKQLNIKFPYIVYAQAMLESNYFQSKIFKENNNMFGMKVATLRQTTNIGEQYNHAAYDSWKECVVDYALYQSRYLSQIKTEEQYFQYLSQSYAEDVVYISKLQKIINHQQLKQLFK